MPILAKTPTVAEAAKAWNSGFAAAVRDAAGEGRLTPKKAAAMTGDYADNAQNYFTMTGKKWANPETVIASGDRYVQAQVAKAAGSDGKLSLVDISKLPADLANDLRVLRGKAPVVAPVQPGPVQPGLASLQDAVTRGGIPELKDFGKSFAVSNQPASKSREDILRDTVGYPQLSDADASDWFSSTRGSEAVDAFAAAIRDAGKTQSEDADEPALIETLYTDVALGAEAAFLPVSQFKSVEYLEPAQGGDIDYRLLLAQKQDNTWLVLQYAHNPY